MRNTHTHARARTKFRVEFKENKWRFLLQLWARRFGRVLSRVGPWAVVDNNGSGVGGSENMEGIQLWFVPVVFSSGGLIAVQVKLAAFPYRLLFFVFFPCFFLHYSRH